LIRGTFHPKQKKKGRGAPRKGTVTGRVFGWVTRENQSSNHEFKSLHQGKRSGRKVKAEGVIQKGKVQKGNKEEIQYWGERSRAGGGGQT